MAYSEVFSVSGSISLIPPESAKTKDESLDLNSMKSMARPLGIRFSAFHDSSFPSSGLKTPPKKLKVGRIPWPDGEGYSEECELGMSFPLDADAAAKNRSISGSAGAQDETSFDLAPPSSGPPPSLDPPQKTKLLIAFGICYCRRDLLPVKLFYLSFIGALGVVYPYISIFLKQIGLSAVQIGLIAGLRPVLGFVSAPVWGSLADRFNLRRSMLIVSMLAWLGFFVGLYFLRTPGLLRTPFPQHPTLHRSRVRFRRSPQDERSFDDDAVAMTTVAIGDNGTVEPLPWNASRCNYSDVSAEDRELLRENLSWIYDPPDVYWTFIICIVIICGGELFQAPTTALTDAATLQVLGRENIAQYGAQRAWGPIGWAISSLSVGSLLNANRWTQTFCGIELSFSDYRLLAYVFMAIMVVGVAAAVAIDFGKASSGGQALNDDDDDDDGHRHQSANSSSSSGAHSTTAVLKLFLNIHYGSWILTTFFVGLLNGIIWGFLFWHLDNLGGTQLLMGVDSVVMCMFEFTAFFFVEHVIRIVGHMGIMYIGLAGYAIRFLIYASITNPWLVLPADALQGVTFSFIWVSLTSYTAVAVPCASLATVQGIVHGVYFGLGNGLGHLVGGLLIGSYGAVRTFYLFAAATVVWLLFFVLCQKFSKKPAMHQFSYQDIAAAN